MTELLIYRGNRCSNSAFALRDALREAGSDAKINTRGNKPVTSRKVINWGASGSYSANEMLNKPETVAVAANKLKTFTVLARARVQIPSWFCDSTRVKELLAEGETVFARTTLTGYGGAGIVVMRKLEDFVEAPLYTLYVPKSKEYRVHVFDGKVIFSQQKRKKNAVNQTPDQELIRNHTNGYVFAENTVEWHDREQDLKEEAIKAVASLRLDFGAVDIILGDDGMVYVLEVNTAPGLVSTKLKQAYVTAIKEYYEGT